MGFKGVSNNPPLEIVEQVIGDEELVRLAMPLILASGVITPIGQRKTKGDAQATTKDKINWKGIANGLKANATGLLGALKNAIKPIVDMVKQLTNMFDVVKMLPGLCKKKFAQGEIQNNYKAATNTEKLAIARESLDIAMEDCAAGEDSACAEADFYAATVEEYQAKVDAEKAAAKADKLETAEGLIEKGGILLITHFAMQFISKVTAIIGKIFKFPSPLALLSWIINIATSLTNLCDDDNSSSGGAGAGSVADYSMRYIFPNGKEVEMPVTAEMFKLFNSAPSVGNQSGFPDGDNVAFGLKNGEVGFFEIDIPDFDEDDFMLKSDYTDDNPQGFYKPPPPHLIRKNAIEP